MEKSQEKFTDINYSYYLSKRQITMMAMAFLLHELNPEANWSPKIGAYIEIPEQVRKTYILILRFCIHDKDGWVDPYNVLDKAILEFGTIPNGLIATLKSKYDLMLTKDKNEFLESYRYIASRLDLLGNSNGLNSDLILVDEFADEITDEEVQDKCNRNPADRDPRIYERAVQLVVRWLEVNGNKSSKRFNMKEIIYSVIIKEEAGKSDVTYDMLKHIAPKGEVLNDAKKRLSVKV